MTEPAVLTERRDGVLVITLNRPDARNAVNGALAEGVGAALDELDADDELRIGVLTGAGKGFSSGMDLKAFVAGESPYVEGRGFAGITQRSSRKPLIAAIEGFAVAGGFEIALSCDLLVASKGARLGIPEVKRSLVAAAGALFRLPAPDPLPPGDGAGPHGRPDRRRARAPARPRQPSGRAGRRTRRRARAGRRSSRTARSRSSRRRRSSEPRATGPRRSPGRSRARSPAR